MLPDSGWISFRIRGGDDAVRAVELLRLSFEIAAKQQARRGIDDKPASGLES
ncbi:MAG: DUF5519 family protein [Chloroflexi bacterium]|nr:DUF5519 family protein [Chloroflexota bacterium]MBI3760270.1 DUF5519 family protein [Chloroflexota bacterium]